MTTILQALIQYIVFLFVLSIIFIFLMLEVISPIVYDRLP